MMANISFLQRKTKNSPAFKLIQAHIHLKQSHLTNTVYSHLKQQTEKQRNQKQKAQDQQFQQELQKKISEQPAKAITKSFSRSKQKEIEEKKRKLLRFHTLSPKRSYQLQTKASVGRKEKKILYMLTEQSQSNNESRQLSRTQTLNSHQPISYPHRKISNSLSIINIQTSNRQSFSSSNKKNASLKKYGRSLSTISGPVDTEEESHQTSTSQVEYFNEIMCEIRKSSKKFEESMLLTQQQLERVSKVHSRMQDHFGNLLLSPKQFPDLEFDNPNNLTKVDRYKYSSNYILENLMSKNDQQVQEWIEREKHKQLRKKGSMAIYFNSHMVSERYIKKLDPNQKNELRIQNDDKIKNFLENPENQINKIRMERNIVMQSTDISIGNNNIHKRVQGKGRNIEQKTDKKDRMSMTDYGRNFKEIKEYEKRKFMSKTAYQPKRNKTLTSLMVQ